MSQEPAAAVSARPSAARARILEVADRLFYAQGIRAVGVDRVVSEAEVTRVTFYRHFPSKDHLITAYLARRLERDQEQLAQLRSDHPGDPRAVLSGLLESLAAETATPGFRGCPYANLTAEYCDQEHPARSVAAEHRTWFLREVTELLTELGVARAAIVAEQTVMLRAGAMAVASVGSSEHLTAALTDAWTALINRPG